MARITTPEAIASYPQLVTPNKNKKFELTLVFPNGFPVELKKAALATLKAKYDLAGATNIQIDNDKGPGKLNFLKLADGTKLRLPWRDDPEDVAAKKYPEDSAFIGVRTSAGAPQPQVVNQIPDTSQPARANGQHPPTLIDASKIYAGSIVKASIDPFCYEVDGNKGVTFGLGNIQFVRDGDRLDNRTFAQDDFDSDMDLVGADLGDLTGETVPAGDEDDLTDLIGS